MYSAYWQCMPHYDLLACFSCPTVSFEGSEFSLAFCHFQFCPTEFLNLSHIKFVRDGCTVLYSCHILCYSLTLYHIFHKPWLLVKYKSLHFKWEIIGSFTKQKLTKEISSYTRGKSITYNREKKHSPIKS